MANHIRQESNNIVMTDDDQVRRQIFQFFRSRWTLPLSRDESLQVPQPLDHVSNQENVDLTRMVSNMEVHEALCSLGEDKAPGPDGFSPLFFHHYWPTVGREVFEAMQAVFHSNGILSTWKKALITLIPKRFDSSMYFG